ncbi:MAG: hypothetical protein ACTSRA_05060 [Promethearchaeota archaeon]
MINQLVRSGKKEINLNMIAAGVKDWCPENTCQECGIGVLVYWEGEIVCNYCGVIHQFCFIDTLIERMSLFHFMGAKSNNHYGLPISALSDITLSNVVLSNRHNCPERLIHTLKWQNKPSLRKRKLLTGLLEIKRIGTSLNLPKFVIDSAALLSKKLLRKSLDKRRSFQGLIVSCICLALKIERFPLELREIQAKLNTVSIKLVHNYCGKIIHVLKLKFKPLSFADLIPRYAKILGVHRQVVVRARLILNICQHLLGTNGKKPKGYVATAIYLASKEMNKKKTQREICKAIHLSEYTLMARIKELRMAREIIESQEKSFMNC